VRLKRKRGQSDQKGDLEKKKKKKELQKTKKNKNEIFTLRKKGQVSKKGFGEKTSGYFESPLERKKGREIQEGRPRGKEGRGEQRVWRERGTSSHIDRQYVHVQGKVKKESWLFIGKKKRGRGGFWSNEEEVFLLVKNRRGGDSPNNPKKVRGKGVFSARKGST